MERKNRILIFGLILLHLLVLIKLKFTAWPEMLLWPYLWIHNILPYKDIAMAHTPILIFKLAVFYKLFGVGVMQLKIFTWLLIILSDILVFVIANKLWKRKVAIFSLCVYIILQPFYDGNGLWFDLLLTPLALITFYLTVRKRYFLSGVFFVLMFLTKQTAIWFLIPIIISIINSKKLMRKDNFAGFAFGSTTVFLFFTFLLITFKILPYFYNWAINFGVFVLPRSSGQIQLPDIKNLIVSLFPFSIFAPLLLIKKMKLKNLAMWTLAGIMGAYPRFEYFHFQAGIPFLAFGTAIFFVTFDKKDILSKVLIPVYTLGSVYLLFSFVIRNYGEGTRFYETDVVDVVSYVKNYTRSGDKIFVMNWWDNIYPLTNTLPSTDPWVPQLAWYQELPAIQDKEVEGLIQNQPKLIIMQDYSDSGLSSYKPQKVYDYVVANYQLKEKIDGIQILIPR